MFVRIIYTIVLCLFISNGYAVEVYTFDPDHSYVEWSVSHFGFSIISGKFIANGTLKYNEKHPERSQIDIKVNVDTLTTGIPPLDHTLMGRSFFDVKTYPTATFVSKKIQMLDDKHAIVEGLLTIRHITQPLVLHVTLNKKNTNPYYHKETYGFSAYGDLYRSKFNMRGYIPGVSDEVKLDVQAEAILNFTPIKRALNHAN